MRSKRVKAIKLAYEQVVFIAADQEYKAAAEAANIYNDFLDWAGAEGNEEAEQKLFDLSQGKYEELGVEALYRKRQEAAKALVVWGREAVRGIAAHDQMKTLDEMYKKALAGSMANRNWEKLIALTIQLDPSTIRR